MTTIRIDGPVELTTYSEDGTPTTREYEGLALTLCTECGAPIYEMDVHKKWHARVIRRPESYVKKET